MENDDTVPTLHALCYMKLLVYSRQLRYSLAPCQGPISDVLNVLSLHSNEDKNWRLHLVPKYSFLYFKGEIYEQTDGGAAGLQLTLVIVTFS